jgi:glycosyltransferase involved in cell wall biosynthesis
MTTVSVVIPAYNARRFIEDAIRSALAQSYACHEIIVVDDGSTDDTVQVASAFPRIITLTKPNGGASSARNFGVHAATGDLIAFLDADDVWHPDKIAAQVALLQQYPDFDLARTDRTEVAALLQSPWNAHGGSLPPHDLVEDFPSIFCNPYLATSTVMVRREAFERVGGFDESLPVAEDIDFYLRLLVDRPRIAVVKFNAAFKRLVVGSLGGSSEIGYRKLIEVYETFLAGRPDLVRQHPKMVARALADLHVRLAEVQHALGSRRRTFESAIRAFRYERNRRAARFIALSCVPNGILRFVRTVRRRRDL